MHTYDIVLPGRLNVRVEVSQPVFEAADARLLLGAYLPGAAVHQAQPASRVDLTIRFRQPQPLEETGLEVSPDFIIVRDHWSGQGSLLDLIHLIYSAARLRWMRRGLYSVHSACVGVDKRGYTLVVGHSGVGKTSIAMHLAVHKGAQVFSGNKTLISVDDWGRVKGLAGNRTITALRDGKREAFELDASKYSHNAHVPITLIAVARLNDGAKSCVRLSGDSVVHTLYPFFADAVNADTVLCQGKEVFAGSVSAASRRRLSNSLSLVADEVPVISVTGSLSYVSKALEDTYG